MALLTCEECGGEVSSNADKCPHCGCPVELSVCASTKRDVQYPVYYDDVIMTASHVLECMHDDHTKTKRAIWDMCEEAGVAEDDETIAEFVDQIYELYKQKYEETPPKIDLIIPYSQAQINQIEYEKQCEAIKTKERCIPKCPVCGSTNLTKHGVTGRAVGSFLFGAFSPEGRAQWICKNCNHMF